MKKKRVTVIAGFLLTKPLTKIWKLNVLLYSLNSRFIFYRTHIVPFSPTEPPNPSYVKKDEWGDDELFTAAKPHQAPKFKKFLQNNSIVEGNKTFLECTVMPAGDPTMVVEWFKDGRPILHGTRMRPIFEFGFCVLEFDDVWAKDGGLYTCRALNKVGQAEVSCRIAVKSELTTFNHECCKL